MISFLSVFSFVKTYYTESELVALFFLFLNLHQVYGLYRMKMNLKLYFYTMKNIPISMFFNRFKKIIGMKRTIGSIPTTRNEYSIIPLFPGLDFSEDYLDRFDLNAIMHDRFSFLNSKSTEIDYNYFYSDSESDLWNFNLNYFEFLFPLINEFLTTNNYKYLDKIKLLIEKWIYASDNNPFAKESYTVSLRVVNWLNCFCYLEEYIKLDRDFYNLFVDSIWKQYQYLASNVETHLMANHYF